MSLNEAVSTSDAKTNTQKSRSPLGVRDFRLLWIGENISLLGDQFYMIALPWLVLQLTGNALALGTVLALASVPRALFMLVGGAITDRFSPRLVMLISNFARMLLVALLAALVFTESIEVWMLYFFALAFGLADAFFFPAQNAIVPQILDDDQLQAGNTFVQGTAQLSLFLGPVLAGIVIGLLGGSHTIVTTDGTTETVPGMIGIGVALAIDAVTFLASLMALWLLNFRQVKHSADSDAESSVIQSIKHGLSYVWHDETLRAMFLLIAGINLLVTGPFAVGLPVLADTRFKEGAAAFGIITAAYGGGSLIGTLLAGFLPRPAPERMGTVLLVVISVIGVMVAITGVVTSTPAAALAFLIAGVTDGYVIILVFTWLQKRTPDDMLGRIMSLLMFSSMGLAPVAETVAGGLIQVNVTAFFVGAGLLMTALTLWASTVPSMRSMGDDSPKLDRIIPAATVKRQTGEILAANIRTTSEIPVVD